MRVAIWNAVVVDRLFWKPLALLLLSSQSHAYTLTIPDHLQPIRDRPYHVSVDACGPAIASEIDRAAAIWNFYAPARFKRIEGVLPPRTQRFASISCQDGDFFADALGLSAILDGTTYWRYTDFQMRSADIIFNTSFYVPRHCSRLHELGHALGLLHSEASKAAMGPDSDCEYLNADDLLGVAALFGTAPNCTPYVSEDFTVYMPSINGEWLELRPIVQGNLSAGFYESAKGQTKGAGWQCDLKGSADEIEGQFYHRGAVFRVKLQREGNRWMVRSVAAQP